MLIYIAVAKRVISEALNATAHLLSHIQFKNYHAINRTWRHDVTYIKMTTSENLIHNNGPWKSDTKWTDHISRRRSTTLGWEWPEVEGTEKWNWNQNLQNYTMTSKTDILYHKLTQNTHDFSLNCFNPSSFRTVIIYSQKVIKIVQRGPLYNFTWFSRW